MKPATIAERRPVLFGIFLFLLFLIAGAAAVIAARQTLRPASDFATYSELGLLVVMGAIVTALRWWGQIGFRPAPSWRSLLLLLLRLSCPSATSPLASSLSPCRSSSIS